MATENRTGKHDEQNLGKGMEEQLARNREQLDLWYETQSERLGVSPKVIADAVLRGWCGNDIYNLPAVNVDRLEGPPRGDDAADHRAALRRIKAAPVERILPTRIRDESNPRRNHPPRNKRPEPEGVSVMELTFLKAAV